MPGPIILVVVLLSFPIVVGLSTAALAALIGGLLMLVLTFLGVVHIRRTPDSATI